MHKQLITFTSFAVLALPSHGASLVEAVAGPVTDSTTGPTATTAMATNGPRTATATRTFGTVSGSSTTPTISQVQPVEARASSDFTVQGLAGTVPLTFQWRFTGSRMGAPDDNSFRGEVGAGLIGSGFVAGVGWSISYVDTIPAQGDFAGTTSSSFAENTAGIVFSTSYDQSPWDGQGSRDVSITMLLASTGSTGTFSQRAEVGLAGSVAASYSAQLVEVTVQDASQLLPGARLEMDNGTQYAITAVPEPTSGFLAALGCFLLIRRNR